MSDAEPEAVEQFHGILAFIPEGSDFDFDAAVVRLREAFPRREVRPVAAGRNRAVAIAARRWQVHAVLVEQPHVAEESREMAEWHRDHPRAAEIAGCRRRRGSRFEKGNHRKTKEPARHVIAAPGHQVLRTKRPSRAGLTASVARADKPGDSS